MSPFLELLAHSRLEIRPPSLSLADEKTASACPSSVRRRDFADARSASSEARHSLVE
jgi:hypothetical protein